MRIIVCGSREHEGHERLGAYLLDLAIGRPPEGITIVHGGCPTGADHVAAMFCASEYARRYGIKEEVHHANWLLHGKAAGPIRNRHVARQGAERCVASWDGKTKGTLSMISEATSHNIPVLILPMTPTTATTTGTP